MNGTRLRELRNQKGMSRKAMEAVCGIDRNAICLMETGKTKNPSAITAIRIARALEVPVESLFFEEELA